MRAIRTAGLLCLGIAWGCASPGPHSPSRGAAPEPPDPAAAARPAPPAPETVSELSLERALAIARDRHPDLDAIRARREEAAGRADQAGRAPNPSGFLRMESAPTRGATAGGAEYVAGITQPIPLGRRLSAARETGLRDVERLDRSGAVRRLAVERDVRAAFATAMYWAKVAGLRAEALRVAEEEVALADVRVAAGDAVPEDRARAVLERSRARIAREEAATEDARALSDLALAIGDPGIRVASIEAADESLHSPPPLDALLARLASSPEFAELEAEVAVYRARLRQIESERIPDIDLEVAYRRLEQDDLDAFDVGVRLPFPLFNRKRGALREAHAALAAAEAEGRSHRMTFERSVRAAHARLVSTAATARALDEEAIPQAKVVLDAAVARHEAGAVGLAAVLLARREWIGLREARIEVALEYLRAQAELAFLLDEAAQTRP